MPEAAAPTRKPKLSKRFPKWMRCQAGWWANEVRSPRHFHKVRERNTRVRHAQMADDMRKARAAARRSPFGPSGLSATRMIGAAALVGLALGSDMDSPITVLRSVEVDPVLPEIKF